MNLMTYDLHGAWEDRTGCVAPLYTTTEDERLAGRRDAGDAGDAGGCPEKVCCTTLVSSFCKVVDGANKCDVKRWY